MKFREDIRLVHGRPLRLRLRRSPRAKRLQIAVSARKGVEVVIPRGVALREVDETLTFKADWIAHQATAYDVWDGPRRRSWATGSELLVLGEPRRLELLALPEDRRRSRGALIDDALRLELPPAELLDPRPALERWLRGFAGVYLRERTEALALTSGLHPSRVIVGERISRWGSCSWRGTISYCYRLVMAPPAVVDTVVIHELCHLAHGHHGPEFYDLVNGLWPDHDQHMAWLRENGHQLEL